uniref:hypothetical protein n=1 Tax=Bordetella sputigena TaxID=1416810 RepID=UPI0039F1498C
MSSNRFNSLAWILEPLERDPTYIHKRMFGCDAGYIDGQLCVVAADRGPPWDGLLVCTSQERHAALIGELPRLRPHPVLGKWLYVPESDPGFERTVEAILSLVFARDTRIGVAPKPRHGRRSMLPKHTPGR